jgi:hypothetical protein
MEHVRTPWLHLSGVNFKIIDCPFILVNCLVRESIVTVKNSFILGSLKVLQTTGILLISDGGSLSHFHNLFPASLWTVSNEMLRVEHHLILLQFLPVNWRNCPLMNIISFRREHVISYSFRLALWSSSKLPSIPSSTRSGFGSLREDSWRLFHTARPCTRD